MPVPQHEYGHESADERDNQIEQTNQQTDHEAGGCPQRRDPLCGNARVGIGLTRTRLCLHARSHFSTNAATA
jgi:hypothetical protein